MTNVELVKLAASVSRIAHAAIGQTRKYTGVPYWHHPAEGVEVLCQHWRQSWWRKAESAESSAYYVTDTQAAMIAAFYLHDVLEDTDASKEDLLSIFPANVVHLVEELTHVYTTEDYPDLNRAQRKELELERMKKTSINAKTLKTVDILINTADIVTYDPGFARMYVKECYDIACLALPGGDPVLHARLVTQLLAAKDQLK